jgi:hypothetical protein
MATAGKQPSVCLGKLLNALRMTESRLAIQGTKRPSNRHDEGDPMLG